jgi:hypothetical protein
MKKMLKKYPCVSLTSLSTIADLLDFDRQRQLLGSEVDMERYGNSLSGVTNLISLTVTDLGSGRYGMNASMMDPGKARTDARAGDVANDSEAALDLAEALAEKLANEMGKLPRFAKDKCDATNQWTGTVFYRRTGRKRDSSERKAGSGIGTITTTTTQESFYDVKIRIKWNDKPQADVLAHTLMMGVEKAEIKIDCARPTIQKRNPEFKSGGWLNTSTVEEYAWEKVEAAVSVTFAGTRYHIKANVPEIQGKTKLDESKHSDGGCGQSKDNNPPQITVPWNIKVSIPEVDKPMPAHNADTLSGSETDSNGGTITWELTKVTKR